MSENVARDIMLKLRGRVLSESDAAMLIDVVKSRCVSDEVETHLKQSAESGSKSGDLLRQMMEFVQRNEGRATIKMVASPRQPKTEESRPRLVSIDFGKYGSAFCVVVPQPDKSFIIKKIGEVEPGVGPAILGLGASFVGGMPRSGKAHALLLQAQKWEEQQAERVKWEKLMGGCWAASVVKEDKSMDNEIRVGDMVEVPGNRRGKVLEINNMAVVDVQVPGGANEIWPIEKLRKIPAERLKVGTKVRITATKDDIPKIEAEGWWNSRGAMEPCLGKIGVVSNTGWCSDRIWVKIDGEPQGWFWAPWALEVVKEDKNRRERGRHTRDGILKAKPVMVRGEERFEITGWDKVLREEELPKAYTDKGYPRFYLESGRDGPFIRMRSEKKIDGGGWGGYGMNPTRYAYEIEVGDLYTPEAFGGLLAELKKAGERLMEINRDIKRREAEWVGPEKEYPI